ncbi:MAG: ABC transporter ATP-binding protein [Acidimicrobiia bacterium]|nr:MAG: ABC transporter ATP-binding protein [Acidimicrobiia bacterium]
MGGAAPLLVARDLVKEYRRAAGGWGGRRRTTVHAVSGVSFAVARGSTLAVVGESGCGKTTTARMVARLERPTAGTVELGGVDVWAAGGDALRALRRRVGVVFQDPYGSLDPRMTVGEIVAEPLRVQRRCRRGGRERVQELLTLVGLDAEHGARHPHEFSGGQRQRIAIARALACEPDLLVLDEPVSALDASVRAGVLNLLADLRDALGLTYLFISHDLAVVRQIADRVAVMYLGRIVEEGTVDDVYARPAHPYTHALLSAAPEPDPRRERARRRVVLEGDVPSPETPPPGCRFHTRCPLAQEVCAREVPPLHGDGGRRVACHFPLEPGETLARRADALGRAIALGGGRGARDGGAAAGGTVAGDAGPGR